MSGYYCGMWLKPAAIKSARCDYGLGFHDTKVTSMINLLKQIRWIGILLFLQISGAWAEPLSDSELKQVFSDFHIVPVEKNLDPNFGFTLPDIPWRIVLGNNELEAVANGEFLAQGETTERGEVSLSEQKSAQLYSIWKRHPDRLWFIDNSRSLGYRISPQKVNGVLFIKLIAHLTQEAEAEQVAAAARESANRIQPLPATAYSQTGFNEKEFGAEFQEWQMRFEKDVNAAVTRIEKNRGYAQKLELQAFGPVFTSSIDGGTKGLDLRRMLVQSTISTNSRVWAPGSIVAELLLSKHTRPAGFGGIFQDNGRDIELWYVVFDDMRMWSKQDLKDNDLFRAFKPLELPAYASLKRNSWPALVFVRNKKGRVMLYGLSMELDRIIQSVSNAQIM